jgi:AraC-like DNA-binding protein
MHEQGCLTTTAGQLVLYETRRPYLFGFSGTMRQFLVDIPREQRRLQRAHQQVTGGSAAGTTIADIAYRCGFSSQAHFTRLFRARFGRTPTGARA